MYFETLDLSHRHKKRIVRTSYSRPEPLTSQEKVKLTSLLIHADRSTKVSYKPKALLSITHQEFHIFTVREIRVSQSVSQSLPSLLLKLLEHKRSLIHAHLRSLPFFPYQPLVRHLFEEIVVWVCVNALDRAGHQLQQIKRLFSLTVRCI